MVDKLSEQFSYGTAVRLAEDKKWAALLDINPGTEGIVIGRNGEQIKVRTTNSPEGAKTGYRRGAQFTAHFTAFIPQK